MGLANMGPCKAALGAQEKAQLGAKATLSSPLNETDT
jgi:hypothetical protein